MEVSKSESVICGLFEISEVDMATINEAGFLIGKAIEWAGVVTNQTTGDAEFVMRFTDGSVCTIGAWQREGFPIEMSVEEISK